MVEGQHQNARWGGEGKWWEKLGSVPKCKGRDGQSNPKMWSLTGREPKEHWNTPGPPPAYMRHHGPTPNATPHKCKGRGIRTPTHRQGVARRPALNRSLPPLAQMESTRQKGCVTDATHPACVCDVDAQWWRSHSPNVGREEEGPSTHCGSRTETSRAAARPGPSSGQCRIYQGIGYQNTS